MQLGAYRRLWILAILTLGSVTLYTLMPPAGYGQEVSAGITGRITDSSGAAVLGAQVTARDVNRGTEWPTVANEEGIYAFQIPPCALKVVIVYHPFCIRQEQPGVFNSAFIHLVLFG